MSKYTKTLKLLANNVSDNDLEKLKFQNAKVKLVICYVSPNLDFTKITHDIKSFFGNETTVMASLTAGELCTIDLDTPQKSLYLDTNDGWESIVLQSFSSDMLQSAEILTIDLACDDLKKNKEILNITQRTEAITKNIQNLNISTKIDYQDTLAFTLIDGLSKSESFFIDAVYKTGKLQCQLIGGSTAGKLDFQATHMFNDQEVISSVAVIVLMKLKKDIRFGILKSQNFKKLKHSFEVLDCSVTNRYVQTVLDKRDNISISIIDYLCSIFNCKEEQLQDKFLEFVFGIVIHDEPFIRSVAKVDLENRRIYFYCDIDFGDQLHLFKTNDFVKQTQDDYEQFLENKTRKPFAGILNDCILRRLINSTELDNLDCFNDVPLIGFSTFGELLGVNINQTLTAVFFFEISEDEQFVDEYMDNFINNYANFKLFFNQRELNILKSTQIKKLNKDLENKIDEQTKELKQQLKVVKDSERKQNELFVEIDKQNQFVQTLLDSQEQIIITTFDGDLESVNETFLDFFMVDDIDEFQESYDAVCICDIFNKKAPKGYLQKEIAGTTWIEYLLFNGDNDTNKVMITLAGKDWIFSVCATNLPNKEGLKSAVFTNITEMEIAKQEIELIHSHTKESIEYAALIQSALIPSTNLFRNYFKDHFVIWHPKDTVGGDIYLFEELRSEDECLLMVIDCTGHGVPGAFVTMLVKAVEREVVAKIKRDKDLEVSTAWIMGYFNRTLKKLLKQETADSISNAGWDGEIIYYNKKTQILKFAGAYTSLFYIDENKEFQTIKGNRYSVGYKKCDAAYEYKETIVNVKEGMKFYCTTDGYLDQNGGEKDFPFGKRRFGNIIKKYYQESMADQQTMFIYDMMDYEAMIPNNDRNDDVTVVAFEIKKSDSKETILEYDGVLTQNIISHSMDILEHNIQSIRLLGKISTIVIELTQNMMKYSKSHDIYCKDIRPAGFIEVKKDKNNIYYVKSKNVISIEDKQKIKPLLEHIGSLDLKAIKKEYKELRRSGKNAHANGGGIGFYEIAKSVSSFDCQFKDINEQKFYYEFNATLIS